MSETQPSPPPQRPSINSHAVEKLIEWQQARDLLPWLIISPFPYHLMRWLPLVFGAPRGKNLGSFQYRWKSNLKHVGILWLCHYCDPGDNCLSLQSPKELVRKKRANVPTSVSGSIDFLGNLRIYGFQIYAHTWNIESHNAILSHSSNWLQARQCVPFAEAM